VCVCVCSHKQILVNFPVSNVVKIHSAVFGLLHLDSQRYGEFYRSLIATLLWMLLKTFEWLRLCRLLGISVMHLFFLIYMHGMLELRLSAASNTLILFPFVTHISIVHLWHKTCVCALHFSVLIFPVQNQQITNGSLLQWREIPTEICYNNPVTFWIKLSFILYVSNNVCLFPNWKDMFHKYKTNSS
jgi:hypothetical protein